MPVQQECDIISCERYASFEREGAAGDVWLCGPCRKAFEAGMRAETHKRSVEGVSK